MAGLSFADCYVQDKFSEWAVLTKIRKPVSALTMIFI
jgi:hypothetical protein